MFKVFILVCSLINSEQCFVLEDINGLVKTEKDCYKRVTEVELDIKEYMPNYSITKYKCELQDKLGVKLNDN
jgi:hypothetical protein